jgi:hypothetical protein
MKSKIFIISTILLTLPLYLYPVFGISSIKGYKNMYSNTNKLEINFFKKDIKTREELIKKITSNNDEIDQILNFYFKNYIKFNDKEKNILFSFILKNQYNINLNSFDNIIKSLDDKIFNEIIKNFVDKKISLYDVSNYISKEYSRLNKSTLESFYSLSKDKKNAIHIIDLFDTHFLELDKNYRENILKDLFNIETTQNNVVPILFKYYNQISNTFTKTSIEKYLKKKENFSIVAYSISKNYTKIDKSDLSEYLDILFSKQEDILSLCDLIITNYNQIPEKYKNILPTFINKTKNKDQLRALMINNYDKVGNIFYSFIEDYKKGEKDFYTVSSIINNYDKLPNSFKISAIDYFLEDSKNDSIFISCSIDQNNKFSDNLRKYILVKSENNIKLKDLRLGFLIANYAYLSSEKRNEIIEYSKDKSNYSYFGTLVMQKYEKIHPDIHNRLFEILKELPLYEVFNLFDLTDLSSNIEILPDKAKYKVLDILFDKDGWNYGIEDPFSEGVGEIPEKLLEKLNKKLKQEEKFLNNFKKLPVKTKVEEIDKRLNKYSFDNGAIAFIESINEIPSEDRKRFLAKIIIVLKEDKYNNEYLEEKLFSSFKNLDTNAKEDILVSFVNSEILDQYVLLSLKTNFVNLSNENKEKVSKILIKELELQYIKQKEEESKYNELLKKHQEQNTFDGDPSISTDNELSGINIIDILILNYNSLDNTSKLYIDNILTNKSRINIYFKSLLIYFDFLPLEITKNISSIIENDKKLTSLLHESSLHDKRRKGIDRREF